MFYPHSIRTRIKTISCSFFSASNLSSIRIPLEQGLRRIWYVCMIFSLFCSIRIPLEQGLRHKGPFSDGIIFHMFYPHSIRTRIKTYKAVLYSTPLHCSIRIPLEQGLRRTTLNDGTSPLVGFYPHSIRTRIKT